MAPRKKSSSSSAKRSNQNHHQQSQPSKFGIQHFFDRHTQNAAASASSNSQTPSNVSTSETPDPQNKSQSTPPQVLPPVATATSRAVVAAAAGKDRLLEVSPEVSKVSAKRFKFSPGMLIKQSQDDGGDEVTWKISPVNERLQAVSKRLPDVIRVLADASQMKALNFRPCLQKENSPSSVVKLEKWLSSPVLKPPERSLDLSKRANLREDGKDHEVEIHKCNGSGNDANISGVVNQQSPFQTPPSVSYCPDEAANTTDKEAFDRLGPGLHRKFFLGTA